MINWEEAMKLKGRMKRKVWGLLAVIVFFLTSVIYTPVFARNSLDDSHSIVERNVFVAYTIQKGDTLWAISKKFEVTIEELKKANKLNGDLIITGKKLRIPQKMVIVYEDRRIVSKKIQVQSNPVAQSNKAKPQTVTIASNTTVNEMDRYWLAKIIEAEAGIESLEGKIAVGAVVLNRVEEEWFPDTIQEVIFQKLDGSYQFSPVGNGRLKKVEPSDEAFEAADRALNGEDPTDGALYFYNPKISKSTFFKKKELLASIGNHQFFQ